MFGINELKDTIKVFEDRTECPVKGCNHIVDKQKAAFKRENEFKCPIHNIYISPSTFEYEEEHDNLLWKKPDDSELLHRIDKFKRESRMARDNSEDAVTWNVFRFLEKNSILKNLLEKMAGHSVTSPQIIYWSYNQNENSSWSVIKKARKLFGEREDRGSEPDIIVVTDNDLFFIEAKLNSGNETVPSNMMVADKYVHGGDDWFSKVFKSDFQTIAKDNKKYELLRFWLIGTKIADMLDLNFHLINLVLSKNEKDIENSFGKFINETERTEFKRFTWEDIFNVIMKQQISDKNIMSDYFKNKSAGYDRHGKLCKAFSISNCESNDVSI